jgi:hypothetical protein
MNELVSSLHTSAGLGIGAGINAYATLLVFGGLSRWRPGMFHGDLADFFSSTPVLITVGVLYAIEFFADKIPAIDHLWDAIHTFIRPVAGALVAWGAASHAVPKGVLILAAVIGGGAALTAHAAKASVRAASTMTTGGTANPFLSVLEDVFAFVNAIVAVLFPWLVLLLIAAVVLAMTAFIRRVRKPQSF